MPRLRIKHTEAEKTETKNFFGYWLLHKIIEIILFSANVVHVQVCLKSFYLLLFFSLAGQGSGRYTIFAL